MEMTIDYGAFRPVAPSVNEGPLYASIDGRASSLANDEVVFFDPQRETSHVMTQQVLQSLDMTREFRPLGQHVARIIEALPALRDKQDAMRRVLESLIKRGLLVTDAEFLRRFESAGTSDAAPVQGLFVRACDRPERVRRLFASVVDHEQRYGSRLRYVLVDDSRRSESVREHGEILRHFGERSGCAAVHITPERWARTVASLRQALPHHGDALRRLLLRDPSDATPRGGGIGRNLITLLAAGGRYALLDDDNLFPLRRHPEFAPGLTGDSRGFAVRTFASRQAALDAGRDLVADPIAAHFAACGRSLSQAMSGLAGCKLTRADLLGLVPGRAKGLRPEARVALTFNGHRGATYAGSLGWLYMLAPAERAGIATDREVYLTNHRDPSVWFGAARYQCTGDNQFTPFAIDNSELMPCTSPWGRGEDALFNALLPLFRRDATMLEFPDSVGHAPEARDERAMALTERPDVNNCLAEFARHVAADVHAEHVGPRIDAFAARLADLAGGSERSVTGYLREYLAYRRSGAIQRMQLAASVESNPPVHWLADLRARVEASGKALIERGPPRFAGWKEDADDAECARHFRAEAQDLIDGLRAWPEAWQVAQSQHWLD